VAVAPGASVTVEFTLGEDELRYWSAAARSWVQDATTYDLGVGGDSTVELGTTFTVTD
jgi:beta-glucosidase